jgi:hypothetical protein
MECARVSVLPDGPDWTYEIKLDGYRAIGVKTGHEAVLYSRDRKNFTKRFPQVATALGGSARRNRHRRQSRSAGRFRTPGFFIVASTSRLKLLESASMFSIF